MYKEDLVAAVMSVLKVGKENTLSAEEIQQKANLTSGKFSNAIYYAKQEFCIIKTNVGYYLPENVEEAEKYYFSKINNSKKDNIVKKEKGTRDYIIWQRKLA